MEEEREVAGGGAPAEAEADPHRELCRILNLPEDAAPGVVSAALRGLAERAESGDALRRELASLRTSAEEKRREELIESGCREGKLSTGQLEWAERWIPRRWKRIWIMRPGWSRWSVWFRVGVRSRMIRF